MQQISHAHSRLEPTEPDLAIIATTLGELIKAISEEVGPQEDHLVAEVVLHLLETANQIPQSHGGDQSRMAHLVLYVLLWRLPGFYQCLYSEILLIG
jgi:hypothetical protein